MNLLRVWLFPLVGSHRLSALDGTRGAGIAVLVAAHTNPQLIPGSTFIIGMFFALSGFIVTYLMVRGRYGDPVQPTFFWAQRVRRLLPPLVFMLVGTALLLRLLGPDNMWGNWRSDMLAALAHVFNWRLIGDDTGYLVYLSEAWPTIHLWTLSAEEQFYFFWPLLFLLPFVGKRPLRFLGILLAVLLGWSVFLYSTGASVERLNWGTDTRLVQIAIGAAAGVVVAKWRQRAEAGNDAPLGWWSRLGAWGALGVIVIACLPVELSAANILLAAVPVAALSALVFIDVATRKDTITYRIFASRPLVTLGILSYAIYLWHMPALWVWAQAENSGHVPDSPLLRFLAVFGAAIVMSIVSWVLVEGPLLLVDPAHKRPRRILLAGGVAALAVTAAFTWWVLSPSPKVQVQLDAAAAWECPDGSPLCNVTTYGLPYDWSCPEVGAPCLLYRPEGSPTATVLLGGDSVTRASAPGLVDRARSEGWEVWGTSQNCSHTEGRKFWWTTRGDLNSVYDSSTLRAESSPYPCEDWPQEFARYLEQVQPDVYIAGATSVTSAMSFDGGLDPILWFDPDFVPAVVSATRATVAQAAKYDAKVVFLAPPGLVAPERCLTGDRRPLGCPPPQGTTSVDAAIRAYSTGLEVVASESSDAAVASLSALVCGSQFPCPVEHDGVVWRPDGLHYTFESGRLVGERIADAVADLLRTPGAPR